MRSLAYVEMASRAALGMKRDQHPVAVMLGVPIEHVDQRGY